ncbi:uncharacterized protein E5676_scaffold562G00460 [Cucumis melo var. makuwa]|uniref:Uncharacterized protein n=1 Tax=Cucumis melo var. makuwa TaxID=1194695 RepID=A0A5D3BKW7_CUCMM|nr:uncharacterized protein E5676_scaffold562G00460 [Cucumis melo var. makuwa]
MINDYETLALMQATGNVFKNGILKKMTDPGSFTVQCSIGIKEVQLAQMVIQFANRSTARPKGKIEDVLVMVDKFMFPTNFIILDYKAGREVHIILRWSFLSTGRAIVDVHQRELTMWLSEQEVKFNVVNAMKFSSNTENYNAIESLV